MSALGHKQTFAPQKFMSALPPIATLIAYFHEGGPATVHLLHLGRPPYNSGMVLRSSRGRPLNAPAAFIHPCRPIVAKQPLSRHSTWDDYASFSLGSGGRMSGSYTDLRSPFSFKYLKC
jgi:hypothetical protein